jgi:hypothetical protein
MHPRNTLILAVVVAALGAFLYFYEIRGQEERAEAEEAAKHLFPDLSAEEIDAIVLTAKGGERVRLERSEEAWRITEPVRFPADPIRADSLASSLASLSSEAIFEEPEPLEEYGIGAEPSIRFSVGEVEHALHIGDKTPVGGNTYLKTGAGAQVYAVKSYHASALSRSLQELRESRILDFDRDAVDRIEAKWPDGGVVLAKGEEGWELLEPLEALADAETVEDLLSDLKFLRADGFIDEVPADAEVGLDAPAFQVALFVPASEEGEAPTRIEMAVGATSDGTHRAVRGSVEDALYQLGAERLEDFPRTVAAYRFKDLADFAPTAAVRFELAFPATEEEASLVVRGELGEEGWTTAPETMADGKASQIIAALSSLTADDIVADAMGDEELRGMGLSPPAVTLRAFAKEEEGEEAALLAEVHLGNADPERGIAAQRSGDEVVYRVDYELAERLPISREAFVNRFRSSKEVEDPGPEAGTLFND